MFIAIYLLLVLAIVSIAIAWGLRRVVTDLDETDRSLHSPGASTVSYLVPDGQDPAVLEAALQHVGYASISDERAGRTFLVVDCQDDADRTVVRRVIEDVHTTSFDGVPVRVGPVSFVDET